MEDLMKKITTLTIYIISFAIFFWAFGIVAYLAGLSQLLLYMPLYIFLHVIFFMLRVRFKKEFIGYFPALIPLFLIFFQLYLIIQTYINLSDTPIFLGILVALTGLLFLFIGILITRILEKTYFIDGIYTKTDQIEKTLRLMLVLILPLVMTYLFLAEALGNTTESQLVFLGATIMSTVVFALGLTFINNNSKVSLFKLSWISALIFIVMFFYMRIEVISSLMALASSAWLFIVLIKEYFFKRPIKK